MYFVRKFHFSHCEIRQKFDPMFPGSNVNGSVTWSSRNDRTIEEMTPLRWKLSFVDLLRCPEGIKFFQKFLESEYSGENLKFWIAVKKYKSSPGKRKKNCSRAQSGSIFSKNLEGLICS